MRPVEIFIGIFAVTLTVIFALVINPPTRWVQKLEGKRKTTADTADSPPKSS
jgi:hypothetical protein